MIEKLKEINEKKSFTQEDKDYVWSLYKEKIGNYDGNCDCIKCIKRAIRKLIE
jgi:hypothetical protein